MSLAGRIFTKEIVAAILILFCSSIAIFFPTFLHGLLPFPGDLLTSFFFPWNSGGFVGFDQWTTHKEFIASDVIRQIYPWKELVIDQFKSGQWPLWNPYNFSGTPLLANLQSSVFSPVNLIFLFLPFLYGWIALVIFLPMVFGFGTHLLLRSHKISFFPAILGGLFAMNLSYITLWEEQLIHIQSVLFLPYILLLITLYKQKWNYKVLLVVPILLACSVFGGHIQTVAYVTIMTIFYLIFQKISLKWIAAIFLLTFLLAAVQLFPTIELYRLSAREGPTTLALFPKTIFPPLYFVTLFAPDYFGNPAVNNYWGLSYGSFQTYMGIVAVIFSLMGVVFTWENKFTKFLVFVAVFSMLFASTPIAYIWPMLKIPVLSSGNASRFILLVQFSFALLASLGLNIFFQNSSLNKKKIFIIVLSVGLIYLTIGLSTVFIGPTVGKIALKNLILPSAIAIATLSIIMIRAWFINKSKIVWVLAVGLILLALVEYSYFFTKYQPFSPEKFVFPSHPVTQFLKSSAQENRFFGFGSAQFGTNFATHYRIFAPEGYDSLYIRDYGEFLAASQNGKVPSEILRSDAEFGPEDNSERNRVFDILGVRYILDKDDLAQKEEWKLDPLKFSPEKYDLSWRNGKFFIYSRKSVLPRATVFFNYQVVPVENQIETFFDKNFDAQNTLILSENPRVAPSPKTPSQAKIMSYEPNRVEIKTISQSDGLLFLSDTFFPGWKAFVDSKETKILKADFTFRAIKLPFGSHRVVFKYDPISFKLGLVASLIGFLIILGLLVKQNEIKK